MNTSYLFYDIETTGLNKCFDQVLQFAAIRTDTELKELERYEIFVKLNPTTLPSPYALITHRIGISNMLTGEPEPEAIKKIHAILNTPGTISLGYNTLGFDDEFLRFSFYRNLLPPYSHQFANQCYRMDIYPMVIMYYLYNKDALKWPQKDGRLSLKLEEINKTNQLAKGMAHNAMVDVEATLALTRLLKQQSSMWDYVTAYFQKNTDLERQKKLPYSLKIAENEHQEGIMVTSKIGYDDEFQAPVVYLGQHNHYRNQTLWLRLDQQKLQNTTADTIPENTFVFSKKTAENHLLLPPLERFLKHLPAKRKVITDENRLWLQKHPEIFQKISQHYRDFKYPVVPDVDIRANLYNLGFPSPYEEKLYAQFNRAKPQDKEAIALQFADPVRQELAMRLLAEHYPNYLSEKNKTYYESFKTQCDSENQPKDYQGKCRLSKAKALQEIHELYQSSIDQEQKKLLHEFEDYLTHL